MVNVVLKKEIKALKERQGRLERLFYSLVGPNVIGGDEEIQPSYLRKLQRISRDLDRGKGRAFASLSEMKRWLKKL